MPAQGSALAWYRRAAQIAIVALILALPPGELVAQPLDTGTSAFAYERSGFWLRIGFGYGGIDITCDVCTFDRE